jgi:hypothetical protein
MVRREDDVYLQRFARTSDSIVASAIDRAVPSKMRSFLVRSCARSGFGVASDAPVSSRVSPMRRYSAGGIFPLPVNDSTSEDQRAQQAKDNAAAVAARQQRLAQLTESRFERQAADEILTTFALRDDADHHAERRHDAPGGVDDRLRASAASASLSDSTRTRSKIGVSTDGSTSHERSRSSTSRPRARRRLFTGAGPRSTIVRLGGRFVPSGASGGYTVVIDLVRRTQSPGPSAVVDTTPPDDTASVPSVTAARILGIADLLVVEQELLRYDAARSRTRTSSRVKPDRGGSRPATRPK